MITREHYWVGFFAMTIAHALKSPDPEKILRPTLQRFLQDDAGSHLRSQVFSVMQSAEPKPERKRVGLRGRR